MKKLMRRDRFKFQTSILETPPTALVMSSGRAVRALYIPRDEYRVSEHGVLVETGRVVVSPGKFWY